MCSVSAPTISQDLDLIKGHLFWLAYNTWLRFIECFCLPIAMILGFSQGKKKELCCLVSLFASAELGRERKWLWSG